LSKAIQITEEAYNELVQGKELALRQAKKAGNKELSSALMAMGIGAFAGWLIYRSLREISESQEVPMA
jgi:hypothetical protein